MLATVKCERVSLEACLHFFCWQLDEPRVPSSPPWAVSPIPSVVGQPHLSSPRTNTMWTIFLFQLHGTIALNARWNLTLFYAFPMACSHQLPGRKRWILIIDLEKSMSSPLWRKTHSPFIHLPRSERTHLSIDYVNESPLRNACKI